MHLPIPEAALAQHAIALGKTGSGKSSALRVLVEAILHDKKRVCILDPKGDWWGLKLSATGKSAGFPVVIFGGDHADVPINPRAGGIVAEVIATGNRPCIIDLGGWSRGDLSTFFIDYAHGLFRSNKSPLIQVIDEVHNFAPQGKIPDPNVGHMLHWANRLASEGRGKNMVLLTASQRPQKTHKDFVTSMETLIAMRVIHPLDRAAMKDWMDGAPDREKGSEVLNSLAAMKRGEAWVWSPEIGYGPERIKFPLFKTYDSFSPQTDAGAALHGWAEVDLEDVKAKLDTVVAEQKANDPKELRNQIAELKRQLALKPAAIHHAPQVREVVKEVTVTPNVDALTRYLDVVDSGIQALKLGMQDVRRETALIAKSNGGKRQPVAPPARPQYVRGALLSEARASVRLDKGPGDVTCSAETTWGACERAVINVLAQRNGLSKEHVAVLAGYAHDTGHFRDSLGRLRTAGVITGQSASLTLNKGEAPLDLAAIGGVPDILNRWRRKFHKCENLVLDRLLEFGAMSKEELAQRTGYVADTGHFRDSLGRLRTANLITRGGQIKLSNYVTD